MEGNELKGRGIDVVIGIISDGCNQMTMEQVGCLEAVPTIEWKSNGLIRKDLHVDEIQKRNPEVVLVDQLAHKNRPSAKNPTRLEDVMELIKGDISVITTINIYELKGVKKVAEHLLNLPLHVSEILPENTLTLADEVRLLDVTPEAILKRLQEGKIMENNKKTEADMKLYNRDNLAVLRELSLRFLAGEVEEDLTEHREQEGLMGPSGASERILVCVQYHWNGSILIRRGDQIAKRLGGDLVVVSFIPSQKELSKEESLFKSSIQKLIVKLNGKFEERAINGGDIAKEIVGYAMKHYITRIILGQSKRTRWEEIIHGSIVNKILGQTKNIDVCVVADRTKGEGERVLPAVQSKKKKKNPYRRLSPEEIKEKIQGVKRGTLKVYIGSAPGVGKTYTMLREANQLKKSEIDIVIGLLETHGRKETASQVDTLETIAGNRFRIRTSC